MAYAKGNNTSGQDGYKKEDRANIPTRRTRSRAIQANLILKRVHPQRGRRVQKSEITGISKLLYEVSPKIAAKA